MVKKPPRRFMTVWGCFAGHRQWHIRLAHFTSPTPSDPLNGTLARLELFFKSLVF